MRLISTSGNPAPDGAVVGGIKAPDGVVLRFARWDAPAHNKGTVCVFGGRGEFIEKYFETVRELRQRGFAVATMDWRGQGLSSRQLSDPRKGHVGNFAEYESDVAAFLEQVVFPDCPRPHFAMAHSMGGAVLLRVAHAGRRWFERSVLVSPMIGFHPPREAWPLRVLVRALCRAGLGESYVQSGNVDRGRVGRFDGNPLTTDPLRYARNSAIVEADPAVGIGAPTLAWLDAAFDTIVAFRAESYPAQIDQPVLVFAAGADRVVSPAAIQRFAARLPAGAHRLIEGARHEILQEQDRFRAQLWAAFDAFMPSASI